MSDDAKRTRSLEAKQSVPMSLRRFLREWILPFTLEVLVIVLLIKFVFFFARVPSGSMIPTIMEDSWLFATRIYNIEESVQRGDILIFTSDELGITLIKRVIGLPGEQVDIRNGVVFIDGEQLHEDYVVNHSMENRSFTVPDGCYFFCGDNRTGSDDARFWDNPYIPAEKINGKAVFTIFPFSHFGILQ